MVVKHHGQEELPALQDKAGEPYWTAFWQGKKLPRAVTVAGPGPRAWFYREFHRLWAPFLAARNAAPLKLLEIGCARSPWLPYFAREWGCAIAGLDYSARGCRQSRALLVREGIQGEIFHQDLFHPKPSQLSFFDVVFSNGVVEHFQDPEVVLARMADYLRPGGLMLTIVPNLTGWLGRVQQLVSPMVMATHTPLTREDLIKSHEKAGLQPQVCTYLGFLHFSVVNPGQQWPAWQRLGFLKGLKLASALAAVSRRLSPQRPLGRRTAAYLLCIATKTGG
ncbi:MAG: class I SAM-dependent methyltransferase [Desulfobaccales bacterium]